jgi:hypothetical protein
MPKGYVIFTEKISDLSGYGGYVRRALPTVVATGISPGLAAPVTRWPDGAVDETTSTRAVLGSLRPGGESANPGRSARTATE